MLVYLSVEDIVLIEKLEINLSNGFTVLTGETGAGKSIIIDAVSLILGKRSEKRLIRKSKDKGTVTALFHLDKNHSAIKCAKQNGFAIEHELILRRQILNNGRSFCYLNDQLITLNFMKEISNLLIEIHGQNEQIGLLDSANHKKILDQWANLNSKAAELGLIYDNYKDNNLKLNNEKNKISHYMAQKQSFMEDLQELNDLKLKPNELEELQLNKKLVMSAEKISNVLSKVNYYLNGDENSNSFYQSLSLAKKEIEKIIHINKNFSNLLNAIDQTIIEYKEIESELENCISSIETNSLDINYIENRLFTIKKIATKHNTDVDKLDDIRNALQNNLSNFENHKDKINNLENLEAKYLNDYMLKSKNLFQNRIKASEKLTKLVNKELPILKLDNAKFRVKIYQLEDNKVSYSGIDDVFFEVETNKGSGFDYINKIASGGELSRLMLAIKVSLFSEKEVSETRKTIIFDEIDTGVGGAVADAIGKRLEKLGKNNQVLVVTHHPQVAAKSKNHLKVTKNKEDNFMKTKILDLSDPDKLEELARMLSGEKITDAARKAAQSLIAENKNIR